MDADLNTMDYEIATDGGSFTMQHMCIAGLIQKDGNDQVQPDLAESWDISDDGLTYTFHLRDGLKWSDGTPLTANDFVFGWQRLVDPDTASEYNYIMSTICVENAADIISGAKDKSTLEVEAPDDQTFVVHLTQPCSFLLGLMNFPSFLPLNEAFYEKEGDQYALSVNDLLYCGPYTMTDWQTGNEYTFTKNPDYWDADRVTEENVTFKFIQDTQSAMLAYQQGDIDAVKLTGEQVDAYKDQDGYQNYLQGYAWRLDFNYNETICQNKDLREAFMYGIDRESICTDVLKDGSVPATGFIPTSFTYGPDGEDYRKTAGDLVGYDAAKAASAYEKAKEANGGQDITVELLFEDSESSKAVAENIQSEMQASCPGLTINLNSKPKKTRLQLMSDHDYQIGLTRWGPDYADPQTYMDLFKSDIAGYTGTYSDSAYNDLMNAAEVTDVTDASKRWDDIIAAEKVLILDDDATVPVYQNGGAMMINPKVTGITYTIASGFDYRFMSKES
jgi:oligopeptide transport system substrate-binding protein